MIEIKVNVTDNATPALRDFIGALTGSQSSTLNQQGGKSAQNAAIAYHHEFDKAGGWLGKRHLGSVSGEGGSFGAAVAQGWSLAEVTAGGATISNDADHYAFKVSGGTIVPKRWDYLTLPLIPEAKGLLARTYARKTGRKLFRPRRKDGSLARVLAETVEGGKGFRSVYALMESVTMGPWPGALPHEDLLAGAFMEGFYDGLRDLIEKS
jgi:hypothetical protein